MVMEGVVHTAQQLETAAATPTLFPTTNTAVATTAALAPSMSNSNDNNNINSGEKQEEQKQQQQSQHGGGGSKEEPNVSWQDIKSVQNLIERCLQKFMTQTEIIAALQVPALSFH